MKKRRDHERTPARGRVRAVADSPGRIEAWRGKLLLAAGALAALAVIGGILLTSPSGSALPGLQTSGPPWSANSAQLRGRLAQIGLEPLTMEGAAVHTHQHLDLFVDGRPIVVPANIGINPTQGFLAALHTHDSSGILHVESPRVETFTLGQFFDVWGVALSPSCVGGACQQGQISTFVNGTAYAGNPRELVLAQHDEICVCVGVLPARIPSRYDFPAGL